MIRIFTFLVIIAIIAGLIYLCVKIITGKKNNVSGSQSNAQQLLSEKANFCNNCGGKLTENVSHCTDCGTLIRRIVSTPSQSSSGNIVLRALGVICFILGPAIALIMGIR